MWPRLACVPATFVLYGGTAIALRLGHRQSVDFDFFSNDEFNPTKLLAGLTLPGSVERLQSEPNTLTVVVHAATPVKLSFFGGLSLHRVGQPGRAADNGVQIASLLDLAATKMAVIQDRAERKDYLDIHAMLNAGVKLEHALGAAAAVYGRSFNPAITLKAMTFFGDGDLVTLPTQVQSHLTRAATGIASIADVPIASDRIDLAVADRS